MRNVVKDIKTKIVETLNAALTDIENAEGLEEINERLTSARNMCVSVDMLCHVSIGNPYRAICSATDGMWAEILDMLAEEC